MKYFLLFVAVFFVGCGVSNKPSVPNTKCYVNNVKAPFWICYQSPFEAVGKVKTKKTSPLKEEEAFSLGVSELISKLSAKTMLFLRRIGEEKESIVNRLKSAIKNFVIISANEESSWFNGGILYVKVSVNKDQFKKMLFNQLKNIDKNKLQEAYDEVF